MLRVTQYYSDRYDTMASFSAYRGTNNDHGMYAEQLRADNIAMQFCSNEFGEIYIIRARFNGTTTL